MSVLDPKALDHRLLEIPWAPTVKAAALIRCLFHYRNAAQYLRNKEGGSPARMRPLSRFMGSSAASSLFLPSFFSQRHELDLLLNKHYTKI